jgi:sialic acid synthase SpsE
MSDHTLGITVSIAAVAQDSCLFEKYFTLNRAGKGLDNEFSIELYKLQQLCQNSHDAWQALRHVVYDCHPAEAQSKVFRQFFNFVHRRVVGKEVEDYCAWRNTNMLGFV